MQWITYIRLVTACIGLIYTYMLFNRAWEDLYYVGSQKIRRHAAITTVLIFVGGLITQSIYVVTAVLVVITNHRTLEVNDYLFTAGAIASTIIAKIIHDRRVDLLLMLKQ